MSEGLKSEAPHSLICGEETQIPRGNDTVFLKPNSSSRTRCPSPELLEGVPSLLGPRDLGGFLDFKIDFIIDYNGLA